MSPDNKKSTAKGSKSKKSAERFSKKDLEHFRKILLEMRTRIAGNLEHLEEGGLNKSQRDASGDLSGYSYHMADMATDNFDREFTIGLASTEQNLLNDIDTALRKLDEGTFGICEKTEKPITKKRLLAMPYAKLCLEAQELEEKEKGRS